MKILGIDWGRARLGMAISDPGGIIASPLKPIEREGNKKDIERIVRVIREEGVERIVVGIPLGMGGEEGESAKSVNTFCAALEEASGIEVMKMDERYSTRAAERALIEADLSRAKRKKLRDGVAAAWFLQAYLDSMPRNQDK